MKNKVNDYCFSFSNHYNDNFKMKKYLFVLLLSVVALYSCSDSKDNIDNTGGTGINQIKRITCNGQPIKGDIETDAHKVTTFQIEIDNVNEKDILWMLEDEIVQEGSYTLKLEGRSGELKVGTLASTNATRTTVNGKWHMQTIASLRGPYKQGVIMMENNDEFRGANGFFKFITNDLEVSQEHNLLQSINNTSEGLEYTNIDLHYYNNKIYLAYELSSGTYVSIFDAQTFRLIKKTAKLQKIINKIMPLDGGAILGVSYDIYFNIYRYNSQKDEWAEHIITSPKGYAYTDSWKSINLSMVRGKDAVGFAYGEEIVVLDNKSGNFKRAIHFGENCNVLSLMMDKTSTNILALVDAPIITYGQYLDPEHLSDGSRLITLDENFNVTADVKMKEKHVVDGKTVFKNTALYPNIDPRVFNRAIFATTSYHNQEVFIPSDRREYLEDTRIKIFKMDHLGIMSEYIEISDMNEEFVSYYERVVTTRLNQLFTSFYNYDESRIQVYNLNQEGSLLKTIPSGNHTTVLLVPIGQ